MKQVRAVAGREWSLEGDHFSLSIRGLSEPSSTFPPPVSGSQLSRGRKKLGWGRKLDLGKKKKALPGTSLIHMLSIAYNQLRIYTGYHLASGR